MRNRWLAALALLAVASGCGGGGGGGSTGGGEPIPGEDRTVEFTVSVPGATQAVSGVQFFQDQALQNPGVRVRSSGNRTLGRPGASQNGQQQVAEPMPQPFTLVVHMDASGSIDDNGRDPDPIGDRGPQRFDAARGFIAGVGEVAGSTPTRVYTFSSRYGSSAFKRMTPSDFPANNGSSRSSAISAAAREGAEANSPALTATFNIIGDVNGRAAMLLLTDGENNAESETVVPGCQTGEGTNPTACRNTSNVVQRADATGTRVYVAGLGNQDQALSVFSGLARDTGAVYVKASQQSNLQETFNAIGQIILRGGVVVPAETEVVENVPLTGNPIVEGWMRFNRPSGGCPSGTTAVGDTACRIAFGF
jgi:hypothetical protein